MAAQKKRCHDYSFLQIKNFFGLPLTFYSHFRNVSALAAHNMQLVRGAAQIKMFEIFTNFQQKVLSKDIKILTSFQILFERLTQAYMFPKLKI